MDFTFTTFDKETETYLVSQNESTGLSQEKLNYSNIKNGLGFIGSRNIITYFRKVQTNNASDNMDRVLSKYKSTKKLGFGL
jgi:hypothetical protein